MNINDLIKLQDEFDSKHKGNNLWNEKITEKNIDALSFLLIALIGEVGETSNIVKKIIRGDFALEEKKEDLTEEITDVFIYLIKICNQLNIDIEKSYLSKMEKNYERFKKYEHKND